MICLSPQTFRFLCLSIRIILHNMLYTDGGHWERKSWYLKAGVIYTLVDGWMSRASSHEWCAGVRCGLVLVTQVSCLVTIWSMSRGHTCHHNNGQCCDTALTLCNVPSWPMCPLWHSHPRCRGKPLAAEPRRAAGADPPSPGSIYRAADCSVVAGWWSYQYTASIHPSLVAVDVS